MSSRLVISSGAICLGTLATYFTSAQDSPSTFPYGKALVLSAAIYISLRCLWKCYLWPFHFSPLRKLPQAPYRFRWTTFFTERNGDQILELVDSVPNEGVFRYLDQLNSEVVHVTSAKAIQEAFQAKGDDFEKPPELRSILTFALGNGLIASEGHEHKLQRKHTAPAFTSRVVRNLSGLFWAKACETVSLMKSEIETQSSSSSSSHRLAVVNIDNWTGRASLDIIAQAGIGQDFESLAKPESRLIKNYLDGYFPASNSKWIYVLLALTNPVLVSLVPFESKRKIGAGIAAVTEYLQEVMETRQAEMHARKGGVGDESFLEKSGQKDLISHVMNSGVFSTASIVDQARTLLGAGHDTSTTSLTWGIYYLSKPEHHHIQQRLRDEIRANLPSPSTGIEADADTLDNLPYLDAVCKEILRLRPPVPAVRRNAIRDTEICGYPIPKGARIGCGFWAINQSKVHWGEDAREFNPERWLVGDQKTFGGADSRAAFMTFGWGRRACVGKGFAMAENKVLMAAFIGSFEFKPVGGKHRNTEILWGVTARVSGGVDVEATILDGW